jgi:hypothetical protein
MGQAVSWQDKLPGSYAVSVLALHPIISFVVQRKASLGNQIEGVNLIKVHDMYEWKYDNETPLYN